MLCPPTAKVGKTSLIMSLVGEEFPEEVSVITDVTDGYYFHARGKSSSYIM